MERAMAVARFDKSKAAKQLGLARAQLYAKLRRHGLEWSRCVTSCLLLVQRVQGCRVQGCRVQRAGVQGGVQGARCSTSTCAPLHPAPVHLCWHPFCNHRSP